jgi:hypothetical protein
MQGGKTAKVSFYYLDDDAKMHAGSIAVEHGAECYVNYLQQPADLALELIARLRFAKVTTLPSMQSDHSGDGTVPVPMAMVLEKLDPGQIQPAAVAPAPAQAPVASTPAVEVATAKQPHVFYSHLALQKDALELLESLFGVGAHKKVEEFARTSPPHQHPAEFLGKCRQHAAMMVGGKKAEELFKPIFDKLS